MRAMFQIVGHSDLNLWKKVVKAKSQQKQLLNIFFINHPAIDPKIFSVSGHNLEILLDTLSIHTFLKQNPFFKYAVQFPIKKNRLKIKIT